MAEDYYKILSVGPRATQKEIEEAAIRSWKGFRKNNGLNDEKRIKMQSLIKKAKEVLTDPLKRLEYDIEEGYRNNVLSQTKMKKVETIPLKFSESLESLQVVKIPGELDYDKLEKSIGAIDNLSSIKLEIDMEEPSAASESKINYRKHGSSFDSYMKNEERSHSLDSEKYQGRNTSDIWKTDSTSENITHKNDSLYPSIKTSGLLGKTIPAYESQPTVSSRQQGTENGEKLLKMSLKSFSRDTHELSEENTDKSKSEHKDEVIPFAKQDNKPSEEVVTDMSESVDDDKLEKPRNRTVSQNKTKVKDSKNSDVANDHNISTNDSDRESDTIASLNKVPKSKIISDDILRESTSPESKIMSRDSKIKSSDEDERRETEQNTKSSRNESSLKDSHRKDIDEERLSGEDIVKKNILEQVGESAKERNMQIPEKQQMQKSEDAVRESASENINFSSNISDIQSKGKAGVKASHDLQETIQTEDDLTCRSSKDVSKVYVFKPEELNTKHSKVVSQSIEDCMVSSLPQKKSSAQSKESLIKKNNGKTDSGLKTGTLRNKSFEITSSPESLQEKSFDVSQGKMVTISHIIDEKNMLDRRRTEMSTALKCNSEKFRTRSAVLPKKPSERFHNALKLLEAIQQTPFDTKIRSQKFEKEDEDKNVEKEASFAQREVKSLDSIAIKKNEHATMKKIPLANLSDDVIAKKYKEDVVQGVPSAEKFNTKETDKYVNASEDSKEKEKLSASKEREIVFHLATQSSLAIPASFEHHFEKHQTESLGFPKKMQRRTSERFQNAVKLLEAIQKTPLTTKISSDMNKKEEKFFKVFPFAANVPVDAISKQKETNAKKVPLVTRLSYDEITNGHKDVAIKEVPLSRSASLDIQSKERADDVNSSTDFKQQSQLILMPAVIKVSQQSLDNLIKQSDSKMRETKSSRRKDSEMDNEAGFFEKGARASKSLEITPSFVEEESQDKIIPTIAKDKTKKDERRDSRINPIPMSTEDNYEEKETKRSVQRVSATTRLAGTDLKTTYSFGPDMESIEVFINGEIRAKILNDIEQDVYSNCMRHDDLPNEVDVCASMVISANNCAVLTEVARRGNKESIAVYKNDVLLFRTGNTTMK